MLRKGAIAVLAAAGVASIISFTGGASFSRFYWGYTFTAPSFSTILANVQDVSAYQHFELEEGRVISGGTGRAAFFEDAATYETYGTDYERGRLAFELRNRGQLPGSALPVGDLFFTDASRELEKRNVLVAGEPGYSSAKLLRGNLALARDHGGREVLLVALAGGEVSNDHYPQYHAAFHITPTGLRLIEADQYFIDIAGIEDATWWRIGLVFALFLVPVSAVAAALGGICVGISRRRKKSLSV